jgi:D-alanyl-D-alanine carboxypeptidase
VLHGRITVVALLVTALLGAPASAPAATSLDAALRTAARRQHAPQVSAAIVRDGRVVWSATTGGARPSDRFVIASATKTLVATLVLRLVDEGRLALADPVERYVPGIPYGTRIALADLLAHRSGLAEYFGLPGLADAWDDPDHAWSMEELLAAIRRSRPAREPGTQFVYTNTNYVLLGAVLEQVTGEGLEALLRRELTDPLGLRALSFERVAPAGGRLVTGHERHRGRLVDLSDGGRVPNDAIGAVWPDGGIATTATDLARFLDALLGGRLLAPATLAQMTDTADDGYGYGLETISAPGGVGPVIGHDGVYGGYTSYDFRSARTGTTLVVLANLDTPADPAWSIADALWRAGAATYSR